MRTPQRIWTVIGLALASGCATSDATSTQYAEVARIVGAGLTDPYGGGDLGAFADSLIVAHGWVPQGAERDPSGVVRVTHGNVVHRYYAACMDAKQLYVPDCGPTTTRALILAAWKGPTLNRGGYWTIEHPRDPVVVIYGDTWMQYTDQELRLDDSRDVMMIWPEYGRLPETGGMIATITIDDGTEPVDVHGDIGFVGRTATIDLDGERTTEVDLGPVIFR